MNKKGVTLLELIIVMVIIGISAVLLAPNIGPWITNYRLRSATRDLISTMRTAQMKAVTTNTTYGVSFDTSSHQIIYLRTTGGLTVYNSEGDPSSLPRGVGFENNTFPIDPNLNKPFAQFNPDSTSSTGGVTLKNQKGSKRITLTAATGRIRVAE